jgi:ribosome-binding ATPase YchF (GTP1/OBG family)
VNKKIAELRAAAAEKQQAVVPLANGESQIDFFDDDEEEEKVVEEQDSEDWDDMPEAQLNAKISEMKKDLGLKTNQAKVGPVAQVKPSL